MPASLLRSPFALGMMALLLASCSVVNAPSDVVPFAGAGGLGGAGVGPGGAGPGGAGPGGQGGMAEGGGGQGGQGACGDGFVDITLGETCDPPGSCPTACDDLDACTTDSMSGSAATCNVVCSAAPAACADGDGCCPAGCSNDIDIDCPLESVLLLSTFPVAGMDVQAKQAATGAFSVVDHFDLAAGTPTLDELLPYDVLLVFPDFSGADAVTFGDHLADYYDQGGRVVLSSFAMTMGVLQGRFADPAQGYLLFTPEGQDAQPDSLGAILEPGSPLVLGVTMLTAAAAYRAAGPVLPDATVVASWGTGVPLIVRGTAQGRNRVDINLYPGSNDVADLGFWVGDGTAIIRNALLFK